VQVANRHGVRVATSHGVAEPPCRPDVPPPAGRKEATAGGNSGRKLEVPVVTRQRLQLQGLLNWVSTKGFWGRLEGFRNASDFASKPQVRDEKHHPACMKGKQVSV